MFQTHHRERPLGEALRPEVTRVRDKVLRIRRHLHAHPELAFQEVRTAALVAGHCRELGLRVRTGIGGTGVLADLTGTGPGPTVLVRADMDALPIDEGEDDRPHRSTMPGVMHACGHDGHVAVALGVAEVLARLRPHWTGRVRMCFQPAEEIDAGAERMIEEGALRSVDYAVGLHLQAGLPTGVVGIGPGVQWASSDELRILVRGKGGHAGDPRDTVDPIAVAARILLELQAIPCSPRLRARAVATVGQIHAGTAPNVVPEVAELAGTVRTMDEDDRRWLLAEMEHTARVIASAGRTELDFSMGAHCPAVMCDPDVTGTVHEALAASLPAGTVVPAEPGTASDDMGRFLREVPGCYFRVGISDPSAGEPYPHHHPRFDIDERALPVATHALARAALALLGRP
ncbi:M20 metallopeptidase family protein [Thermoactinospora rubra]|uniref:M20 metallopeptidase family protein n=1 Tax=Thermoactinospora rubra TaxID=1088767 RepID=UPI00117CBE0B|nr:M20 family metallopeptidase [Thermoactinospora rubra]